MSFLFRRRRKRHTERKEKKAADISLSLQPLSAAHNSALEGDDEGEDKGIFLDLFT